MRLSRARRSPVPGYSWPELSRNPRRYELIATDPQAEGLATEGHRQTLPGQEAGRVRGKGEASIATIPAERQGQVMRRILRQTKHRTLQTSSSTRRLSATCEVVRFEKDILRTGTWYPDGEPWVVTTETLDAIVSSFNVQKRLGNRIPLQWGHNETAKDVVGEVESLERRGNTLYAVAAVEDCDASRKLSLTTHEVSVGIDEPWMDGTGRRYPIALVHLAIVANPVIPKQGKFRKLSLGGSGMCRRIPFRREPQIQCSIRDGHLVLAKMRRRHMAMARITGTVRRLAQTMPVSEAVGMIRLAVGAFDGLPPISESPDLATLRAEMAVITRMLKAHETVEHDPADPEDQRAKSAVEAMAGTAGTSPVTMGHRGGNVRRMALPGEKPAEIPVAEVVSFLNLLLKSNELTRSLAFPASITVDDLRSQFAIVARIIIELSGGSEQAHASFDEFVSSAASSGASHLDDPTRFEMSLQRQRQQRGETPEQLRARAYRAFKI